MYGLTKKQKLEFILKRVAEYDLTAYDIGKKIDMSASGIEKILKGISKNPQEKTLNKIIDYLQKKVLGTELSTKSDKPEKIEEQEEIYSSKILDEVKNNPLIICLNEKNKLTLEIIKLQNILRDNNIKFKDIFENEEK